MLPRIERDYSESRAQRGFPGNWIIACCLIAKGSKKAKGPLDLQLSKRPRDRPNKRRRSRACVTTFSAAEPRTQAAEFEWRTQGHKTCRLRKSRYTREDPFRVGDGFSAASFIFERPVRPAENSAPGWLSLPGSVARNPRSSPQPCHCQKWQLAADGGARVPDHAREICEEGARTQARLRRTICGHAERALRAHKPGDTPRNSKIALKPALGAGFRVYTPTARCIQGPL